MGGVVGEGMCVPKSVWGRVGPVGGSCPRMGGFEGTYVGGRLVAAGQSISKNLCVWLTHAGRDGFSDSDGVAVGRYVRR